MMGYMTPNIDRIAKEGVCFTDYYGQQSCTAGRAAFIGGNVPLRTGMTKVGMPAAKEGWQKTDATQATVMKSLGYATGQFGKNHQGDRATATNTCRPCTGSTSSSATSTTSTPRKSRRTAIIPAT
jgi:arylsulfatase